MTSLLFMICNTAIVLFWMLLLFFPRQKITLSLMAFPWIPLVLSFFYAYFLFGFGGLAGADFSSLEGILKLFKESTPESAAAGWLHYLAFDFWMGCWIVTHSQQKDIPHLWIVLPLFCTFLLGPMGVMSYTLIYYIYPLTRKK